MYTVVFKKSAVKELKKLPEDIQNQIQILCKNMAQLGPFRMTGLKSLKGFKDTFRYRIGKYRILFHCETSEKKITIIRISLRDKAYVKL